MRRTDREIKELAEMVAIMYRCDVCRLALHDNEYPYILPLNFGIQVQDEKITLYFHGAAAGKKYELLAKDNRVSFEMDDARCFLPPKGTESCTASMAYESVIGQGILSIVPEEEKRAALCAIMQHYGAETCQFNPQLLTSTTVLKLEVGACTGKRHSATR